MSSGNHSGDHLASSFTDLMSSLMVIFVLLLLVFISHTSHRSVRAAENMRQSLQENLVSSGLAADSLLRDPNDPNAILVVISGRLMNFENQQSSLKPSGKRWLEDNVPKFAAVVCSPKYVNAVEALVVEGHTDSSGWVGKSDLESEDANLELSQRRSLTVVQEALRSLARSPSSQSCLLDRLSASGRGQRDLQRTPESSRRVVFRIRVKSTIAPSMNGQLASSLKKD